MKKKKTILDHLSPSPTHAPPQSLTHNLVQDKNGNLWLASWEGIVRYDGKTVKYFKE